MNKSDSKTPGLYIHVPFCKSKCPYCDFYSVISPASIPPWLEGIKQEAMLYKKKFPVFDTLFLGGGTPTILKEQELTKLFDLLFKQFVFSPTAEITIEANPDDLTKEKLHLLRERGVNRISLGAQSFNDHELRYLGRRHTGLQNKKALEMARAEGFMNISIDLMYGLEGQNEKSWMKTLKQALSFRPEHISCYQLTIKKGTKFDRKRTKRLDENTERMFFINTAAFLEEAGYAHYEVSNYALSENSLCRHNRKYWDHTPYLGLGPAAHSFGANKRWWNVKSIKKYCDLLTNNQAPVEGIETLSEKQLRLESVFLGLRTSEGIDRGLLNEEPATNNMLQVLKNANLIKIKGRRIIPTREGLLVADSLPLFFPE